MELQIESFSRREVLQYLGWRGEELTPETAALIEQAAAETLETIRPQYVWRVFAVETQEGVRLPEAELALPGRSAAELLEGCRSCVLLAATLGAGFDRLLVQTQPRDMARALVLDACGSAAIEAVCDRAEEEIGAALGDGAFLTDRFSPGYGDMPLEAERPIVRVLDTDRRIGLTLTESCMLLPRKSVTAILGVAGEARPRRFRGCAHCELFDRCLYRKAGKTCGKA